MGIKVTVIKMVQLRSEHIDYRGTLVGYNSKFQRPTTAAIYWSGYKAREWERKKFNEEELGAAYHRMDANDHRISEARRAKLYRRSLPVFERMLSD